MARSGAILCVSERQLEGEKRRSVSQLANYEYNSDRLCHTPMAASRPQSGKTTDSACPSVLALYTPFQMLLNLSRATCPAAATLVSSWPNDCELAPVEVAEAASSWLFVTWSRSCVWASSHWRYATRSASYLSACPAKCTFAISGRRGRPSLLCSS